MTKRVGTMAYGGVGTPVCWYYYMGTSPENMVGSTKILRYVAPCKYPWEIPCGIIEESSSESDKEIIVNGGVWVNSKNLFPLLSDVDDNVDAFIGRRVYFDRDCYVIDNYCTRFHESTFDNLRGLFPGSATVGYILSTRENGNEDEFYIKFDPRPPTADYVVARFSTDILTPEFYGLPVAIEKNTNTAIATRTEASLPSKCDGILCRELNIAIEHPAAKSCVIVCTRGRAWASLDLNKIYTLKNMDDYISEGYNPISIPLTNSGCFALCGQPNSNYPLVGDIHWHQWLGVVEAARASKYYLIDVNPRTWMT